jgi:hypothetical protein
LRRVGGESGARNEPTTSAVVGKNPHTCTFKSRPSVAGISSIYHPTLATTSFRTVRSPQSPHGIPTEYSSQFRRTTTAATRTSFLRASTPDHPPLWHSRHRSGVSTGNPHFIHSAATAPLHIPAATVTLFETSISTLKDLSTPLYVLPHPNSHTHTRSRRIFPYGKGE